MSVCYGFYCAKFDICSFIVIFYNLLKIFQSYRKAFLFFTHVIHAPSLLAIL